MNTFQSLLDSYSELRKRTYKLSALNAILENVGATVTNARRAGGSMHDIPEEEYGTIRAAFNTIGDYTADTETLLGGFSTPQEPPPDGQSIPDAPGVWLAQPPSPGGQSESYNFRGSATKSGHTASLPIGLKESIIKFLTDAEQGGASHSSVDNDAAAGGLVDANGNPLDPEAAERAQEIAAGQTEIAIAFDALSKTGIIPYPEKTDVHALQGPTQIYPPGHPYGTTRLILSRVCEILFGLPNIDDERIHRATLQLQEDTVNLMNWFSENQEALDKALTDPEGCIPYDENIAKLRNRFYFANTNGTHFALTYGNYHGEDPDPCEMSGLMEDLSEDDLEQYPGKDTRGKGYKQVKEQQGSEGGGVSLGTSKGSVASGWKEGSNPLHQLVGKYQSLKMCDADGKRNESESLFQIDHVDSASNLVSTLSENSTVIANQLLHAKNLEEKAEKLRAAGDEAGATELEGQAGELNSKIAEVVAVLIEACEKYEKQTKELARSWTTFEKNLNKGTANSKHLAIQAVQDDLEDKVGSHFKGRTDKCKENTLQTLTRDLTENPIHNAVREMHESEHDFEGNVTVSMTHPDTRSVNKIYGIMAAHEGIYDVPYPTRATGDEILICDTKNDMKYMLRKLGIRPGSEDYKLALTPQKGKYILPISDKLYRQVGPTSNGAVKTEHWENTEYVKHAIDSNLSEMPEGAEKGKLRVAGLESIRRHNAYKKEAFDQIVNPKLADSNSTAKERIYAHKKERSKLDAALKVTIVRGKPKSKSYKEAQGIKSALKELDKLDQNDPTYPSKASALADRVAEYKEQEEIDKLSEKKSTEDGPKERELRAGRAIRRAITLTASGPGVIAVKHAETGSTVVIPNQLARNAASAQALALLRGDTKAIELMQLKKQVQAGSTTKKQKNGNVKRQASQHLNAGELRDYEGVVRDYLNP
tara:strand:+ start:2621 stop:5416 length:2796 start_codon:yes stop_codon:yes gene_type:complete